MIIFGILCVCKHNAYSQQYAMRERENVIYIPCIPNCIWNMKLRLICINNLNAESILLILIESILIRYCSISGFYQFIWSCCVLLFFFVLFSHFSHLPRQKKWNEFWFRASTKINTYMYILYYSEVKWIIIKIQLNN